MRPVYHQREIGVETHVFLAVLAFHLQAVIERTLKEAGDPTSWKTLREEPGTHHVVTTPLPTADGKTLAIRRGSVPRPEGRGNLPPSGPGSRAHDPDPNLALSLFWNPSK